MRPAGSSPLLVRGGDVLTDEPALRALDVEIEEGRIIGVRERGSRPSTACEPVDATGLVVAPGFIDLQVNGGWGGDITSNPAVIDSVRERLPSTGVTSFCPTVITAPVSTRRRALAEIGRLLGAGASRTAAPLGLHLEGPVIDPERAGAHDPAAIPATIPDDAGEWSGGRGVAVVTLAPERPGALDLVSGLVERGVTVALGHTSAGPEVIAEAMRRGASMVTHLFNAMAPFSHRRPGPVGAVLASDALVASVICDGVHVHPTAVSLAWKILGVRRTILVSDTTAVLRAPDAAPRTLGGRLIVATGGTARTYGGDLAGSVLTLDQALRNLVAFTGCSAAEALLTVTANPAKVLGIDDRGRIESGCVADLVLLTPDLEVVEVLIGGERLGPTVTGAPGRSTAQRRPVPGTP